MKPKSVDEILMSLVDSMDNEGDGNYDYAHAKQDIYSLLVSGVEDKEPSVSMPTATTVHRNIPTGSSGSGEVRAYNNNAEFNQANALWRKHLQTKLGLMPREEK